MHSCGCSSNALGSMTMAPSGSDPAGVELVYERIRAAIVESDYEPGQRLIEQKIAKQKKEE